MRRVPDRAADSLLAWQRVRKIGLSFCQPVTTGWAVAFLLVANPRYDSGRSPLFTQTMSARFSSKGSAVCAQSGMVIHSPKDKIFATLSARLTSLSMNTRPREIVFTLNALIDGHVIRGEVSFSPAPDSGIMTEIARLEAERLLAQMVREEIADGRL